MFRSAPGFILAALRRAAASSRAVDRRVTIGSKAPIQMAHSANSPVVDTLKGRSSVSTSHAYMAAQKLPKYQPSSVT